MHDDRDRIAALNNAVSTLRIALPSVLHSRASKGTPSRLLDALWFAAIAAATGYAAWTTYQYLSASLGVADLTQVIGYGLVTLARVVVLMTAIFTIDIGENGGHQVSNVFPSPSARARPGDGSAQSWPFATAAARPLSVA